MWATAATPESVYGSFDHYFTAGLNVGTPRSRGCRPSASSGTRSLPPWSSIGGGMGHRDRRGACSRRSRAGALTTTSTQVGCGAPSARNSRSSARSRKRPDGSSRWRWRWTQSIRTVESSPRSDGAWSRRTWSARSTAIASTCGDLSESSARHNVSTSRRDLAGSAIVRPRILAAGRPVILQATGFDGRSSHRDGPLAVESLEEAVDAVQAVVGDYRAHSGAALAIAHAVFDSAKVCGRLLSVCGL